VATSGSLVYIESADANSLGTETPLDHLRVAEKIAAERGHPAESFTRTAAGHVLTPEAFGDHAFDFSPRTGRAVAARSVEASQWGMPPGADYVSRHMSFTAAAQDPASFARIERPAWAFTYVGAPGDQFGAQAAPASVYGNAQDIRVTPAGNTAVTLQLCRDPAGSAFCLFAHDLDSGQLRLLTRLREPAENQGDLSVSPDGRYLLAGSPLPQLVDIATGHCAGIGRAYRAATWYPRGGPSCVLAVTGDNDKPPWKLVLLDLSTFAVEDFAELPRRVDGLQAAADGTLALRMQAPGEPGRVEQLVVSTDNGRSFEPAAPLRGASGWLRRSARPRWIEAAADAPGPVTLHAGFEEFLRQVPADNGYAQGEAGWVLDTAAYLIKHRVTRLRERPPAADILLSQLGILAALATLFDPGMAAEVIRQVVPVAREASARDGGRAAAGIEAVAAGRQPPPFTIKFGPPAR
jgi:hypothetical protein